MKVKTSKIILKNGKDLILRSPEPNEAEILLQHLRIAHTESYKNLNQSGAFLEKLSIAEEEKILADFLNSKTKFMLTAFFENEIVGVLGFIGASKEFQRRNASIGMFIQQAYCNFGLGTEMMRYALALGKGLGFHRVDLTVRASNGQGIALYEKVGFKRVGLLKDAAYIDENYVDEYLYQIILD